MKMKFKTKLITNTLLSFLLFGTFFSYSQETIYEDQKELLLNDGLKYINISKLTDTGYENFNILEYNLKSNSTDLDIIYNPSGFKSRETLSKMISSNTSILSGLNADFFSMSTESFPLGLMVQNGKVLSNPHYQEGKYASFLLDFNNNPILSYLKSNVSISNITKGNSLNIAAINKPSQYFGQITLYTPEYTPYSPGANDIYYDLCEVVVIDDKISEIRKGQPSIQIPANGYILLAAGNNGSILENKFNIGDSIKVNYDFNIDVTNIKTAIGGGTILLKDGEIQKFSATVKGKSQRTAMGIKEDKLIFVVCDGRLSNSKGMDETDIANYLKSIGCTYAIAFDGGGSTEMIVNNEIKNTLINSQERKILNGLVFKRKSENVNKITKIEAFLDRDYGYINEDFKINISLLDDNNNSIPYNTSTVKFEAIGVDGEFIGNKFHATSAGKGFLKISYEDLVLELPITIIQKTYQDSSFIFKDLTLKDSSSEISDANDNKENEVNIFETENNTKEDIKQEIQIINNSNTTLSKNKFDNLYSDGLNISFLRSNPSNEIDMTKYEEFSQELLQKSNLKILMNSDLYNKIGYKYDPTKLITFNYSPVVNLDSSSILVNLKTNNGNFYSTPGQWKLIKDNLNSDFKNIIFVLDYNERLNFNKETYYLKKLFNSYSESKNIYFIYEGDTVSTTIEGNVKYISIPSINNIETKDFFVLNMNNNKIIYTKDYFKK